MDRLVLFTLLGRGLAGCAAAVGGPARDASTRAGPRAPVGSEVDGRLLARVGLEREEADGHVAEVLLRVVRRRREERLDVPARLRRFDVRGGVRWCEAACARGMPLWTVRRSVVCHCLQLGPTLVVLRASTV